MAQALHADSQPMAFSQRPSRGGWRYALPRAVLLVFFLNSAPTLARAQRTSSTVDLGAASMRYADSVGVSGLLVSPLLRVDWPRARLNGSGTYAQLAGSGWSTQGLIDLSLFTPSAGVLSGELEASTGGSAHWDGTRTGQSIATGRLHVDAAAAGIWLGAGAGLTWNGFDWGGTTLGDAGAWVRVGDGTIAATTAPTRVGDTLRYIDTQVAAHWKAARVEVAALAGVRVGDRVLALERSGRSWGGLSVTTWLTPRVAIVAALGTYPVDLTQGFPGGRYATLNLRLSSGRSPREPPVSEADAWPLGETPSVTSPPSLELLAAPNGARVLRLQAPGARDVEIMGDFSDWKPARLTGGAAGLWTLGLPLRPGIYQAVVRVDGGTWTVPGGLLTLTDEFGGAVGLLVVR